MPIVSIAIETTCRNGGVALGLDRKLCEEINFSASARHATQLVSRLKELLESHGLGVEDLNEVYISSGPGSFTGLRVGMTVARTLGLLMKDVKFVSVPTPAAIAENARELEWHHLGVVLDAKDHCVYGSLFGRRGDEIIPLQGGQLVDVTDFLASLPRPITLIGEGLGYHDCQGEGITLISPEQSLPTPRGVFAVGSRLAAEGSFTPLPQLLPVYARKPEAVRLWEKRGE